MISKLENLKFFSALMYWVILKGKKKFLKFYNLARGIDIRQVGLVINMSVPRDKNDKSSHINTTTYLHRVARTGRYLDKGVAVTIFNPDDRSYKFNDSKIIEFVKKKFD